MAYSSKLREQIHEQKQIASDAALYILQELVDLHGPYTQGSEENLREAIRQFRGALWRLSELGMEVEISPTDKREYSVTVVAKRKA